MASDTALNLVNEVFVLTGDYTKVTTVVGSPADIAERVIKFMNITVNDLARKIDFPILESSFTGTGDGTNSQFISSILTFSPNSAISCTVNTYALEEVSRKRLNEARDTNDLSGVPQYFATISGANNELGVDIYPTPSNGATIKVLASSNPTLFTVSDTSTIELDVNDLIVLGAIAHMDAFAGMERGYMQLYEAARNRHSTQMYSNQQFRITPEDYR